MLVSQFYGYPINVMFLTQQDRLGDSLEEDSEPDRCEEEELIPAPVIHTDQERLIRCNNHMIQMRERLLY